MSVMSNIIPNLTQNKSNESEKTIFQKMTQEEEKKREKARRLLLKEEIDLTIKKLWRLIPGLSNNFQQIRIESYKLIDQGIIPDRPKHDAALIMVIALFKYHLPFEPLKQVALCLLRTDTINDLQTLNTQILEYEKDIENIVPFQYRI